MTEPVPTDEQILDYERAIKAEDKSALVSELEDFQRLESEYDGGNQIQRQKIADLKKTAKGIRCVKKDGNCFYRAFGFRFCEILRTLDGPWKAELLSNVAKTKDILKEMGYDMELMIDFYEPFENAILKNEQSLLEIFTTAHLSDTIVCYLRILTAAVLRKDRDMFEAFVLDSYPTLDDFIAKNVEPMNVESDQIHLVAMANAFGLTIKVGNLDSTPDAINYHEISPIFNQVPEAPVLTILYRPGHYDILYL